MKDYIEERAIEAANYIIDTRATVRQTADKMGISKSTVHKDITERLVPYKTHAGCPGQGGAGRQQGGETYKRRACHEGEVSACHKVLT